MINSMERSEAGRRGGRGNFKQDVRISEKVRALNKRNEGGSHTCMWGRRIPAEGTASANSLGQEEMAQHG